MLTNQRHCSLGRTKTTRLTIHSLVATTCLSFTLTNEAQATERLSGNHPIASNKEVATIHDANGNFWVFYVAYDGRNDKSSVFVRSYDGNTWGPQFPIVYPFPGRVEGLTARADLHGKVGLSWQGLTYYYYPSPYFAVLEAGADPNTSPVRGSGAVWQWGRYAAGHDMDFGGDQDFVIASMTESRLGKQVQLHAVIEDPSAPQNLRYQPGPDYNLASLPRSVDPQPQVAVESDGTVHVAWYRGSNEIVGQQFSVDTAGTLSPLTNASVSVQSQQDPRMLQLAPIDAGEQAMVFEDGLVPSLMGSVTQNDAWGPLRYLEYQWKPLDRVVLGYSGVSRAVAAFEQGSWNSFSGVYGVSHSPWGWDVGWRLDRQTGHAHQAHVDVADDGSAVVVWRESSDAQSNQATIYAARLTAAGSWLNALTVATGDVQEPRVAVDTIGNFIVTWSTGEDRQLWVDHIYD